MDNRRCVIFVNNSSAFGSAAVVAPSIIVLSNVKRRTGQHIRQIAPAPN